ncbi:radical SAM protein [Methylomonas sp. MgM2]
MMLVFGPVPSRRLGNSLGINNIPPKHCSYSCLYCQVGETTCTEIKLHVFYKPEAIFDAVERHLAKLKPDNPKIDYLTFVPDGEPTLDAFLGKAIGLLQRLKIKIAVISNASLIWRKQVRDMLKQADWVSLKMDSVDEAIWRRINRPDQRLNLDDILSGMLDFKQEFQGTLVTETMLLQDINTGPAAVEGLGLFFTKIGARQKLSSHSDAPYRR